MLYLIGALAAFILASLGAAALDNRAAARARLIARAQPRGRVIATPYVGPLYNRHGRAIGESF